MNIDIKQRIRVTAICKKGDDILFLKRAGGRLVESSEMEYELPTGKITFGEQPEEAMARVLYEYTNMRVVSLRLTDVVTFTNLEGASQLGNLYIIYDVELDDAPIVLTNERYSAYKWAKLSEIDVLPVNEASSMALKITSAKTIGLDTRTMMSSAKQIMPASDAATIYTDGGSRGNPGPSGLGYYIIGADGREIKRGGEFLGFTSSRLAEYYGLKEGLEQAIELGLRRVNFKSDSLMMVNQMNGVYKVKNRDLMPVYNDVLKLLEKLDAYSFSFVPREKNREADAEVNKIIDLHTGKATF